MKYFVILFSIVFFMLSCSSPEKNKIDQGESKKAEKKEVFKTEEPIVLKNGIYLLKNQFKDTLNFEGDGLIVPYAHDYLDSTSEEAIYFLEIDPNEFIELDLSKKPEGIVQEDNRINLMLTFSDIGKEQMAQFTEKHIGGMIAMVIDGKAYTKHKIRTKITGGQLQITRCTDNACEHLLVALKDNYESIN